MCHSDKTANEWYLRESLTQEAADASLLIEEHTKPHREDSKFSLPHASVKQKAHEEKSMPQDTDIVSGEADSASVKSSTSSKISLTVSQRSQVDKVFAEDLQTGIEPRKKCVVALMKGNIVLRRLVNSQPHVKRVLDRVRYLFETRTTVDPYKLPQESPRERTATFVASIPERPPSSIASGRVEWSNEETEAIQEALTFWRKAPTQEEIRQMFSKSQVLRDIFRNNAFDRIKNKVKNEFRKMSQ